MSFSTMLVSTFNIDCLVYRALGKQNKILSYTEELKCHPQLQTVCDMNEHVSMTVSRNVVLQPLCVAIISVDNVSHIATIAQLNEDGEIMTTNANTDCMCRK